MAEVAVKDKKPRVRRTTAETITEQAKKLSLSELIAHRKEINLELDKRQADLEVQLGLVKSL